MAILELGINYGASYSLNFATDIISNRAGVEQRRALYQQPLLKVAIGNRMVNKEELDYLLAFFEAAQGRLNEFEIRDWTDYQVTDGTLGPVIEGRQSVIKTYSLGGETIERLLTAVVEDTIVDDGGSISCEFNVPVRFDQDAFPLTFEAYSPDGKRLFNLQELTCTEVRKAWPEAPLQVPPASIDADLGIGKDYGTTGGQSYSTSIMALPSGWDDRQANYSGSKSQWNIGSKIVNVAEMTRMITMFRLCRGQLVPFNFYDWQTESTKLVRFDSDSLGLQFEAHQENYYGPAIGDRESLFAINGLPVRAIAPVDTPGGDPYAWYLVTLNYTLRFESGEIIPGEENKTATFRVRGLSTNVFTSGTLGIAFFATTIYGDSLLFAYGSDFFRITAPGFTWSQIIDPDQSE